MFGNLVITGIIDPTKVVRTAIQNATSVAALLIATEAKVAELPKKAAASPAMPPGGGMDFRSSRPGDPRNAKPRQRCRGFFLVPAASYFRAGMETISDPLLASLVGSFVKI